MHEAEVYVVLVYRRDAGGVSGKVENVRQGTATSFHSPQDLIDLILGQSEGDDTVVNGKQQAAFSVDDSKCRRKPQCSSPKTPWR